MKPSEATLVWELWRHRRRVRRNLLSWGAASATAGLVLALSAWGFLPVFNVGEKGEALLVKLGNPDGEDLPLSVSSAPDQVMQALMSAQQDSALAPVEETRPSEPEPAALPRAKPETKPVPQPKVESKPVVPVPAPTKPEVTEKVIRGVEKGNASELILKPQGEKISQSKWVPVYLFLPLPAKLEAGILARVKATSLFSADERRELLLQFYSKGSDGLSLAGEVPLNIRPAVWVILEGAGYDVANADYKKDKDLKPVVISFKLGIPKTSSTSPEILEVQVEEKSGNPAVDEAVLYAFKQTDFANGTGQVAQGRYTYDFSPRK